jgi:hypothetical protein
LGILLLMLSYIFVAFHPPRIGRLTDLPVELTVLERAFGFAFLLTLLSPFIWLILACRKPRRISTREGALQIAVWFTGIALGNFAPAWDPTGIAARLLTW